MKTAQTEPGYSKADQNLARHLVHELASMDSSVTKFVKPTEYIARALYVRSPQITEADFARPRFITRVDLRPLVMATGLASFLGIWLLSMFTSRTETVFLGVTSVALMIAALVGLRAHLRRPMSVSHQLLTDSTDPVIVGYRISFIPYHGPTDGFIKHSTLVDDICDRWGLIGPETIVPARLDPVTTARILATGITIDRAHRDGNKQLAQDLHTGLWTAVTASVPKKEAAK